MPIQIRYTPFPILWEHQKLPQWHSNDQSVCTDTLSPSVRLSELSEPLSGSSHGQVRSYRTGLDSARACHRRETGIGAIGAIGVLSEYYRRSTIELSSPPSGSQLWPKSRSMRWPKMLPPTHTRLHEQKTAPPALLSGELRAQKSLLSLLPLHWILSSSPHGPWSRIGSAIAHHLIQHAELRGDRQQHPQSRKREGRWETTPLSELSDARLPHA